MIRERPRLTRIEAGCGHIVFVAVPDSCKACMNRQIEADFFLNLEKLWNNTPRKVRGHGLSHEAITKLARYSHISIATSPWGRPTGRYQWNKIDKRVADNAGPTKKWLFSEMMNPKSKFTVDVFTVPTFIEVAKWCNAPFPQIKGKLIELVRTMSRASQIRLGLMKAGPVRREKESEK